MPFLNILVIRLNILNIIDKKLFIMRGLAQKVQSFNLSKLGINELNHKLNNLAGQIKALDKEGRRENEREV